MQLPDLTRFSLTDLCNRWDCPDSSIFDLAANGEIEMCLELFDVNEQKLEKGTDGGAICTETIYHEVIEIPATNEHVRGIQRHKGGGWVDFIEVTTGALSKSRYYSAHDKIISYDRDSLFVTGDSVRKFEKTKMKESTTPQATKEKNTLLKIIGGFIQIHYLSEHKKRSYLNGDKPNVSAIATNFLNKLDKAGFDDTGIKNRTLRNVISEAIEEILNNQK